MLLYNFAAAILRGIGDTKRPLFFLAISGLVNVVLNLFFVIVCGMSVEGVAIATVMSQVVSCIMIMWCLIKTKESYRFRLKDLNSGVPPRPDRQPGRPPHPRGAGRGRSQLHHRRRPTDRRKEAVDLTKQD